MELESRLRIADLTDGVYKAPSATTHRIGTEAYLGAGCRDALLVVACKKGTVGISNLSLFTSVTSNFLTDGSDHGASERQALVFVTSDSGGAFAAANIVSNMIEMLDSDATIVCRVRDLKMYANIQFSPGDNDSYLAAQLLTINASQSRRGTPRATY